MGPLKNQDLPTRKISYLSNIVRIETAGFHGGSLPALNK